MNKIIGWLLRKNIKYSTMLLFKIENNLISYSFPNGKDLYSDFSLVKHTYPKEVKCDVE